MTTPSTHDREYQASFLALIEFATSVRFDDIELLIASMPQLLQSPTSSASAFTALLYFLPESTPLADYVDLIKKLLDGQFQTNLPVPDYSHFDRFSDEELAQHFQAATRYLTQKTTPLGWGSSSASTPFINDWVKARIRLVDNYTGLPTPPDLLLGLVDTTDQSIIDWQYSILHVLMAFRRSYAGQTAWISLQEFESLSPHNAVKLLLQFASTDNIVTDVNNLIVPYLNNKEDQSPLWDWIGDESSVPEERLSLLLELVKADGVFIPPNPGYFGFIRAVLAFLYSFPQNHYTTEIFKELTLVEHYFGNFELDAEPSDTKFPENIAETDLYSYTTLLKSQLTLPTLSSLNTFHNYAHSAEILFSNIPDITLIEVVVTSLYGSDQDQIALARKYIFGSNNDDEFGDEKWKHYDSKQWTKVRDNLLWLKNKSHVLSKVPSAWVDETLLISTLASGQFDFVEARFINVRRAAASSSVVTTHLLDAFYENYDKATSCSTSRGGLKKAAKCLELLQEKYANKNPLPSPIERAAKLLSSTDALSKYSLTLTPGVPLHPVELRVQSKDPLVIIHRLLELNPKLYHELDFLQDISKDLYYGITGNKADDGEINTRVRAMCIDVALANSDFEQAYNYTKELQDYVKQSSSHNQLPWTTCYQVGKFVSPEWDGNTPESVLSKQLELLSFTLTYAPKENLPSILKVWERVESQLNEERPAERRNHQQHSSTDILTSASSRFARAIQSSASTTFGSGGSGGSNQAPELGHDEDHTNSRKRDQISNLLVSGLGWAIGANPR